MGKFQNLWDELSGLTGKFGCWFSGTISEGDKEDFFKILKDHEFQDFPHKLSPGEINLLPKKFSFGTALVVLEAGQKVARIGWNGKGMWLEFVGWGNYAMTSWPNQEKISLAPWIGMKTADDKFVPWLCSQTDMLAKDWEVVINRKEPNG